MAHPVDAHDASLVGDFVDHPVVADPDALVVLAAGQLPAAWRARVQRERLDGYDDSIMHFGRKPREVSFRAVLEQNSIHRQRPLRLAR